MLIFNYRPLVHIGKQVKKCDQPSKLPGQPDVWQLRDCGVGFCEKKYEANICENPIHMNSKDIWTLSFSAIKYDPDKRETLFRVSNGNICPRCSDALSTWMSCKKWEIIQISKFYYRSLFWSYLSIPRVVSGSLESLLLWEKAHRPYEMTSWPRSAEPSSEAQLRLYTKSVRINDIFHTHSPFPISRNASSLLSGKPVKSIQKRHKFHM